MRLIFAYAGTVTVVRDRVVKGAFTFSSWVRPRGRGPGGRSSGTAVRNEEGAAYAAKGCNHYSQKRRAIARKMAEGEGFEPPVPCGTSVFKTDALNHSAIPPGGRAASAARKLVGAEGFEPPTVSSQS